MLCIKFKDVVGSKRCCALKHVMFYTKEVLYHKMMHIEHQMLRIKTCYVLQYKMLCS